MGIYKNQNYLLRTREGQEFLIKIARQDDIGLTLILENGERACIEWSIIFSGQATLTELEVQLLKLAA